MRLRHSQPCLIRGRGFLLPFFAEARAQVFLYFFSRTTRHTKQQRNDDKNDTHGIFLEGVVTGMSLHARRETQ